MKSSPNCLHASASSPDGMLSVSIVSSLACSNRNSRTPEQRNLLQIMNNHLHDDVIYRVATDAQQAIFLAYASVACPSGAATKSPLVNALVKNKQPVESCPPLDP
jgi:hypothetical protein